MKDSQQTQEEFIREAELEQITLASRVLPTNLQSPEWSGAGISGTRGGLIGATGEPPGDTSAAPAATSDSEPLGDSLAEGAAGPEPLQAESLPDLFTDQRDPEAQEDCGAGINFARLQRESEYWP